MENSRNQQIKFLITTLCLFIVPLAFFQNCAKSDSISDLKSTGVGSLTGEVSTGLVFTNQPTSEQVIKVGGSTTLSVGVLSKDPVKYQWYKDNQPVTGATSYKLILENLKLTDSGEYYVKATSGQNTLKSNVSKIIITTSDTGSYISAHPTSINVAMNQTGQLTSTVAGDAAKYVVWYKDGKLISENNPYYEYVSDGSGRTFSLKVLAASYNIEGNYKVEFIYDDDSILSETATVSISPLVGVDLGDGNFARIWAQPGHEQENLKAYCIYKANTAVVASYSVSESTFSQHVAYDGNIEGDGVFRVFSAGMDNAKFYDQIVCGSGN